MASSASAMSGGLELAGVRRLDEANAAVERDGYHKKNAAILFAGPPCKLCGGRPHGNVYRRFFRPIVESSDVTSWILPGNLSVLPTSSANNVALGAKPFLRNGWALVDSFVPRLINSVNGRCALSLLLFGAR